MSKNPETCLILHMCPSSQFSAAFMTSCLMRNVSNSKEHRLWSKTASKCIPSSNPD